MRGLRMAEIANKNKKSGCFLLTISGKASVKIICAKLTDMFHIKYTCFCTILKSLQNGF